MTRACDVCGSAYEAKRASSRFCSERCKKRAQRAPKVDPTPLTRRPKQPAAGDLVEATERELEAAGRLDTMLGQQALVLARLIDATDRGDTGSGVASMSKELRAVMAAAMEGAARPLSKLDELRARRDAKRAAAG